MEGNLYAHLLEVEDAVQALLDNMMPGMAEEAGAAEKLKARDPMRWVGLMNCRKAKVEEIIFAELVYSKTCLSAWGRLTPCCSFLKALSSCLTQYILL